jgi:hypothetical protein
MSPTEVLMRTLLTAELWAAAGNDNAKVRDKVKAQNVPKVRKKRKRFMA